MYVLIHLFAKLTAGIVGGISTIPPLSYNTLPLNHLIKYTNVIALVIGMSNKKKY